MNQQNSKLVENCLKYDGKMLQSIIEIRPEWDKIIRNVHKSSKSHKPGLEKQTLCHDRSRS